MKIITYKEYSLLSFEEQSNFTGTIKWYDGTIACYKHSLKHCIDGPSVIYPDGTKKYYITGIQTTKEAIDLLRDLCKIKGIKI
jgi:hypothetical protein